YPLCCGFKRKIHLKAKTIKAKSTEYLTKAFQQRISDDSKPTSAIVFLSVKQDLTAISEIFDNVGIAIFGATPAGEFIDGEIETGSIVVMLLDINRDYFKLEFLETSEQTTIEEAKKLGITGKETFVNPAFIIATGGIFI